MAALTDRRWKLCSDDYRLRHHHEVAVPRFATAGPAALAARRASGNGPEQGGEAGRKRGQRNTHRARERHEWEALHGDGQAEREQFVREIQPQLASVPVERIAAATGLSLRYISLIRRGAYVPHPMHYEALRRCVMDS